MSKLAVGLLSVIVLQIQLQASRWTGERSPSYEPQGKSVASLDYETEKTNFREYYDSNREVMDNARSLFESLVRSLATSDGTIAISKIEGRLKDREECLGKFTRK